MLLYAVDVEVYGLVSVVTACTAAAVLYGLHEKFEKLSRIEKRRKAHNAKRKLNATRLWSGGAVWS